MWQTNNEQHARILSLVKAFEEEIPLVWQIRPIESPDREQDIIGALWTDRPYDPQAGNIWYSGYLKYSPTLPEEAGNRLIERLKQRFGEEFLDSALAEFLAFPDEHDLPKYCFEGSEARRCIARFARSVASQWLLKHGNAYAVELIGERLKYLLLNVETDREFMQPGLRENRHWFEDDRKAYFPHIEDLIRLLIQLHQHPPALTFLKQLICGEWNGPLNRFGLYTRYQAINKGLNFISPFLDDEIRINILESLCAADQLSYKEFELIREHLPRFLPQSLFLCIPRNDASEFLARQKLFAYAQQSNWALAQNLNESNCLKLRQFPVLRYGARWLLLACRYVEKLALDSIETPPNASNSPEIRLLQEFAGIHCLALEDDQDRIVQELREFSQRTLLAVAPHVTNLRSYATQRWSLFNSNSNKLLVRGIGQKLILRALGWDDLLPLFEWVKNAEEQFLDGSIEVINQQELNDLLATLKPERVSALIDSGIGGQILETHLNAMSGRSRKQIMASLKKGSQSAMVTYGLLPLEEGETVLDRYLALKKIVKESLKYGAERQANTRIAVQIGLANLAQTTDFADLSRLEWAMEAQITEEGFPLDCRETIGDWQVELNLDGLKPKISFFKQEKELKSEPAGLRKLDRYLTAKDTLARIKEQIPRLRETLETMMIEQETLTPEDLRQMICLPVMANLLKNLVAITDQGQLGLLNAQDGELSGLQGQTYKLDAPFQFAHPYHFFQAGQLGDWQREVVKRHCVQPFKQVFRELYVLTPAELQSVTFSNRFAGHLLKPMSANGLLRKRAWKPHGNDSIVFKKHFRKAALTAEFHLPDADEEFPRSESVTSDQIRFIGKDGVTALKDIPPLIFSEAMRDIDLVVSVAQWPDEGDEHWSPEAFTRRAELVTALLNDLGIKGVTCEGNFAYVKGTRASYRVHLGSATIHIEPGNYLCIVPDHDKKKDNTFYLPFADTEPKACEVISKILLLVNDKTIKDPSILNQIDGATR